MMPASFVRTVEIADGSEVVTYCHPAGWYFSYGLRLPVQSDRRIVCENDVEEHVRRIWPILGIDATGTAYTTVALNALQRLWKTTDSRSRDKLTEFNAPLGRYLSCGVFTDEACLALVAECETILRDAT